MELPASTLGALLIAAIVTAVIALVVSTIALLGQRRVRASYRVFSQGSREDVLSLIQRHIDDVRSLRGDVAALRDHSYGVREMLGGAVSRVHTVRYDAFDDMGGHMSFSTAFLDEHGDGAVLTAINGRTDTRVYAKAVRAGVSTHHLSEEEELAIRGALNGGARDGEERLVRRGPRVIRDAS